MRVREREREREGGGGRKDETEEKLERNRRREKTKKVRREGRKHGAFQENERRSHENLPEHGNAYA